MLLVLNHQLIIGNYVIYSSLINQTIKCIILKTMPFTAVILTVLMLTNILNLIIILVVLTMLMIILLQEDY